MQYQVTARKWRPKDFSQVVGQEHVTTALYNAIMSNKIPHAYLFSGPRGVGKTSTARILSKILNCIESPHVCGKCAACVEINLGQSLDVREIDGASNRGIEQIREIRDNAIYAPLSLKYKIFIIDEVHMLTKEASNALLKVLEEPPAHVIFMLATTEANKVLPTIRSRCQHYLLKRIPLAMLIDQLALIVAAEGYEYDQEALEEIAVAGDGSMRDSQTILDQVILYTNGKLTIQSTREVLGIPSFIYFEIIIKALFEQDIVLILEQINQYLMEAGDGMSFVENWIKFLRKALLVKQLPINHPMLELSEEKYQYFMTLVENFEKDDLVTLISISLELVDVLRKEAAEVFWIENAAFKMLDYKNQVSLSELRQEIFKVLGRSVGGQQSLAQNISANYTNPQPQKTAAPEKNVVQLSAFGSQLEQFQRERKTNTQNSSPQIDRSIEKQEQKNEQVLGQTPSLKKEDFNLNQTQNVKKNENPSNNIQGDDMESMIDGFFK